MDGWTDNIKESEVKRYLIRILSMIFIFEGSFSMHYFIFVSYLSMFLQLLGNIYVSDLIIY